MVTPPRFMSVIRSARAAAAGALVLFYLFAPAAPTHAQEAAGAQMRVVHTSVDAPRVDVYAGDRKFASGLGFREVSALDSLPAGEQNIKVTEAGKTEPVLSQKVTLAAGKRYTLLLAGRVSDLTWKLLEDDLGPLESGKARVRLVHTSPDTPAVDVAVKDGAVLVPNLGFVDVSKYVTTAAGALGVDVFPAGSKDLAALTIPSLTLEAGKVYTLYVTGLLSGQPSLSVLMVADDAQGAVGQAQNGQQEVISPPISQVLPVQGAAPQPQAQSQAQQPATIARTSGTLATPRTGVEPEFGGAGQSTGLLIGAALLVICAGVLLAKPKAA